MRNAVTHPVVQQTISRLRLSSPQTQQVLTIGVLVVLFTWLLGAAVWDAAKAAFSGADVKPAAYSSFDIYDAESLCEYELEDRLGGSLVRHNMDEHSSRLDKSAGIFRLYFQVDIGNLYDYEEVSVHCFIDKWDKDLAYYREFNPNIKTIKSTDIKFFN